MNIAKTSTTKTGRRKKFTLEEKQNIINHYLIANNQDVSLLKKHGLKETLAKFAKTLDPKYSTIRGYDFYSEEVAQYISALTVELTEAQKERYVGCAYVPLDYAKVEMLTKRNRHVELLEYLRSREQVLRDMYDHAATAVSHYSALSTQYNLSQTALNEQEITLNAFTTEVDRLSSSLKKKEGEYNKLLGENRTLLRTIREHERTIAVLVNKGLANGIAINDDLKNIVRNETTKIAEDGPEEPKPAQRKIVHFTPKREED